METSTVEKRTFAHSEAAEYDALEAAAGSLDAHLVRLREYEAAEMAGARSPLDARRSAGSSGAPSIFLRKHSDRDEDFQGQFFVRKAIALGLSKLENFQRPAWQIAEERWGKTCPALVAEIKSGVAGGSSTSGAWGSELVGIDNRYAGDFVEYLQSITIFDQLNLRDVPKNVNIKGMDGAATAFWVGANKGIPATTLGFTDVDLRPLKVAAIAVAGNELLRDSSPSAEMLIRDALGAASSQRVDTTFLSAGAAVAGVSPAGILNGIAALGSSGWDVANVFEDLRQLVGAFVTARLPVTNLRLVLNANSGLALGLMVTDFNAPAFPDVGASGGTLRGIRVVCGHNVGATYAILIDPSNVWRIGDAGVQIDLSTEATVEQDDTPLGDSENPTAASATLSSMFGSDSTAFRVLRAVNFARRRETAVAWLADQSWGLSGSTTT